MTPEVYPALLGPFCSLHPNSMTTLPLICKLLTHFQPSAHLDVQCACNGLLEVLQHCPLFCFACPRLCCQCLSLLAGALQDDQGTTGHITQLRVSSSTGNLLNTRQQPAARTAVNGGLGADLWLGLLTCMHMAASLLCYCLSVLVESSNPLISFLFHNHAPWAAVSTVNSYYARWCLIAPAQMHAQH